MYVGAAAGPHDDHEHMYVCVVTKCMCVCALTMCMCMCVLLLQIRIMTTEGKYIVSHVDEVGCADLFEMLVLQFLADDHDDCSYND